MDIGGSNNEDITNGNSTNSKKGTPNKSWKPEYDDFLIPILVEQVHKGLKCDKTFKRAAFVFAAGAVNQQFNTNFDPGNVENHYRTLKSRYLEIKKAKDLSGAGWNEELKMVTLDPVVYKSYVDVHPAARPFINKPIDNYEGLKIICGDDYATRSSARIVFHDLSESPYNDEDGHPDEESPEPDVNATQPMPNINQPMPNINQPMTSVSRGTKRGRETIQHNISDLMDIVRDMTQAF